MFKDENYYPEGKPCDDCRRMVEIVMLHRSMLVGTRILLFMSVMTNVVLGAYLWLKVI